MPLESGRNVFAQSRIVMANISTRKPIWVSGTEERLCFHSQTRAPSNDTSGSEGCGPTQLRNVLHCAGTGFESRRLRTVSCLRPDVARAPPATAHAPPRQGAGAAIATRPNPVARTWPMVHPRMARPVHATAPGCQWPLLGPRQHTLHAKQTFQPQNTPE